MAGDIITILFGGYTSFVLRPKGGQFQMIGEAYDENVMDREAMLDYEQGKHEKRMFELI
jgi:hypothetical protein